MPEFDLLAAQRRIFTSALKPLERLVALAICDFYSRRSPKPFPSVEELTRRTGLARKAVMRAIAGLEKATAIRVDRSNGNANKYDLAGLMSLPLQAPDQCPRDTGPSGEPVPLGTPDQSLSGTGTSPSGDTLRNPISNPKKEPKDPRKRAGRPKQQLELIEDPEKASAHKLVTEAYFESFEAARGEKPVFSGKEGKAIAMLLAKRGSPERAIETIRRAFADQFWRLRATIATIAADPDKFGGGGAPMVGSGGVRAGDVVGQQLERVRALEAAEAAGARAPRGAP